MLTQSVKLFGTEEEAGELIQLSTGILQVTLDAGNLRYINIAGKEALRAIAFLVRDRNWGTYNPVITDLVINEGDGQFVVTYEALCKDDQQSLRYQAQIVGTEQGRLSFKADCEALSDFETNRTGFVVLHALDGVVGRPVRVEHTGGDRIESHFPELIDPACPFQDIRALSHEIMPGLSVECRMEGDAFEMEDHRNWMDASYKTYVRPLARPWPYQISKGSNSKQKVDLTIIGNPAVTGVRPDQVITVHVGEPTQREMPKIGLAASSDYVELARAQRDVLSAVNPDFLVCHFDARNGDSAATVEDYRKLSEALGADLVLEAVVPCLDGAGDPSADLGIMRRDLELVRKAASGVDISRIAVSPACDLKCTLPGSVFPPAPSWEDLFEAARTLFPSIPIGGGMFSYFTELNRKRPPADLFDFICHTTCPIVHAGDDVSMTESLEALPSIFKSVRSFSGDKPYWIFPTSISMRDNPYGASPAENPTNIRQAMNRVDPRERGMIGAAWYSGYLAHAIKGGVDAITLAATSGPSGLVYNRSSYAQPWFDEIGAAVFPHFHVISGHLELSGNIRGVEIGDPRSIQALAVVDGGQTKLWLTNLTGEDQSVQLTGVPDTGSVKMLDEMTFEEACSDSSWRQHERAGPVAIASPIRLRPYAVAEVQFNGS